MLTKKSFYLKKKEALTLKRDDKQPQTERVLRPVQTERVLRPESQDSISLNWSQSHLGWVFLM